MTRLDEIEKRLKEATPGPWTEARLGERMCKEVFAGEPSLATGVATAWHGDPPETSPQSLRDTTFIANSPADIAYLLRIARAAEVYWQNVDNDTEIQGVIAGHMDLRAALDDKP